MFEEWARRCTSKDQEEASRNMRGTLGEDSVPSTVETVF